MLINKGDAAAVDGNNSLLKRMQNALNLVDHPTLVSPELDDLILPKIQEVVQKGKSNDITEAELDEGSEPFMFNEDSIQIAILVIDHSIRSRCRNYCSAHRENRRVFVLIYEVKGYLYRTHSSDLNDQEHGHVTFLKFSSLVIQVKERKKIPHKQQKLYELNELRFFISF